MSGNTGEFLHNPAVLTGMFGFLGTIIVGMLSFFGGRGSVQAQIQGSLNESFKILTEQLRQERTRDRVEILQLRGEVRGLEQHISSLETILRANGMEIPKRPLTAPVFVLDSNDKEDFGADRTQP